MGKGGGGGGGGGGVSLLTLSLLGVLLAMVPFLVDVTFRKSYPVHERGVVIVTGACVRACSPSRSSRTKARAGGGFPLSRRRRAAVV